MDYTEFAKLWAAIRGGGEVSREGRVWGYTKFTKLWAAIRGGGEVSREGGRVCGGTPSSPSCGQPSVVGER